MLLGTPASNYSGAPEQTLGKKEQNTRGLKANSQKCPKIAVMLGEVRKHKSVWTQGAKAGKQFTEQRIFRKNLHDIPLKLGAVLFFLSKCFCGGEGAGLSKNSSISVICAGES